MDPVFYVFKLVRCGVSAQSWRWRSEHAGTEAAAETGAEAAAEAAHAGSHCHAVVEAAHAGTEAAAETGAVEFNRARRGCVQLGRICNEGSDPQ